MGNVIEFKPTTVEIEEPEHGGGDGGGEIIIRVIHEYPDDESEPEPEPKTGGWVFIVLGALAGLWMAQ
jgi:hypothetical protein